MSKAIVEGLQFIKREGRFTLYPHRNGYVEFQPAPSKREVARLNRWRERALVLRDTVRKIHEPSTADVPQWKKKAKERRKQLLDTAPEEIKELFLRLGYWRTLCASTTSKKVKRQCGQEIAEVNRLLKLAHDRTGWSFAAAGRHFPADCS